MELDLVEHIIFRVGKELYALNLGYVLSIINASNVMITPLPNTAKEMKGVINYYDEIAHISDLRFKFGIKKETDSEHEYIIICRLDDLLVGFVVDEVLDFQDIITKGEEKQINEHLNESMIGKASSYILGIYKRFRNSTSEVESVTEKKENFYDLIAVLDPQKLLEPKTIAHIKKGG